MPLRIVAFVNARNLFLLDIVLICKLMKGTCQKIFYKDNNINDTSFQFSFFTVNPYRKIFRHDMLRQASIKCLGTLYKQ